MLAARNGLMVTESEHTFMVDLAACLQKVDREALCRRLQITFLVRMEAEKGCTRTFDVWELVLGLFSGHDCVRSVLVVLRTVADDYWTRSRYFMSRNVRGDVQGIAAESVVVDLLSQLSG
jgi:hypothetical protein